MANGGALGLGNVNPTLYALSKSIPSAFHDIVTGNNNLPCDQITVPPPPFPCQYTSDYPGYSAGVGYDLATGLGSIDAANLVAAWTALTPTTTMVTASSRTTTVGTQFAHRDDRVDFDLYLHGRHSLVHLRDVRRCSGPGVRPGRRRRVRRIVAPRHGSGHREQAASPESATATLDTAIPPGLYGEASIVAMYSGDADYLASQSKTPLPVTVAGATLAISPAAITLQPNQQTTLTTTGGVPPVSWSHVGTDTTCLSDYYEPVSCSKYESLNGTTAAFQAGAVPGAITVVAIDAQGQEAAVQITVAGAPVDGGSLPVVNDAGPMGGPPTAPPIQEAGAPIAPTGDEDSGPGTPDAAIAIDSGPGKGATDGTPSTRGAAATLLARAVRAAAGSA